MKQCRLECLRERVSWRGRGGHIRGIRASGCNFCHGNDPHL